jgi:hypothetical protein
LLTRRASCEPQVWSAQSLNGAVDLTPIDLILPVRGRSRAEIFARTFLRER